jgi:hypothetical protein
VQAAVNLTSNGDTVQIPCSGTQSVTWTTAVAVTTNITITALGATPNVGPNTFGAGTNCLTILNNNTTNSPNPGLFWATLTYSSTSNVLTIQNITISPYSFNTALYTPIFLKGTCTSSGCPDVRMDNLFFTGWGDASDNNATWMMRSDNVFGVVDHDTLDSTDYPVQALVNINNSSYSGVGIYGDNSRYEPDSFGTANALYLENNLDTGGEEMVDCDIFDVDEDIGGCRYVGRFNEIPGAGNAAIFANHGTETSGRVRGGRQTEVYDNVFNCTNAGGCNAMVGFRSATGRVFDNSFINSAGGYNSYAALALIRGWSAWGPWGECNGESPYDTNDNGTQSSASTFTSTSSTALTDTSQHWTTNQFAPVVGGMFYTIYDATHPQQGDILSNTTTTLTIKQSASMSLGDTYYILGTHLYAMGTISAVDTTVHPLTITDSGSPGWTTNQFSTGAGYGSSLIDISSPRSEVSGFVGDGGWEVWSNTSDTVTSGFYTYTYAGLPVTVGDTYVILRATQCLDQPGASGGNLLSGDLPPAPTPVSPINETLDPIYEWGDTLTGQSHPALGVFQNDSEKQIVNRNYYEESVNQAAQTSPTSPFNGTSGDGHGTLANRPTTCTQGVGYWATDQGNWNQSGSGGQGELYICTATNVWTMKYEPYTYPHPLITGGTSGTGGTPPTAPTDPIATVEQ